MVDFRKIRALKDKENIYDESVYLQAFLKDDDEELSLGDLYKIHRSIHALEDMVRRQIRDKEGD